MRVIVVLTVFLVVLAGCSTTTTQPEVTNTETTVDAGSPTTQPTDTAPTAERTTTTTTPPPITEPPRSEQETFFPVPAGSVATYAPDPDPPIANSTRVQVFDAELDPPNATAWYLAELDDWTLRTQVESYTTRFGWMNRLTFTRGEETLFVYVTSAETGSEISLARGTETVGMGGWIIFNDMGWEPVTYTTPPVPHQTVEQVVPLGNLAPSGHTFPTDHSYLFIPDNNRPAPVVAPAGGVVTSVVVGTLGDPAVDDFSITIQHSNVHVTKLGHLSGLDPGFVERLGGLEEGSNEVSLPIAAGERIGTAPMTYSTALDWWTTDYTRAHSGFVHPEYYGESVHAMPFLDYATDDLKAAYGPKIVRDDPPRYGKIDYDQQGRLVGNWFLDADPVDQWDTAGHLAFVYDVRDPDNLRIAVGGTVLSPGLFAADGNAPDPATVTVDSSPVVYHLQHAYGSGQVNPDIVATLLVEVLEDGQIRVEGFDGHVSDPSFTADARVYVR